MNFRFNLYRIYSQFEALHWRIKSAIRRKQKRLDFIGIGVQKAGTTALFGYLRQHPDIGDGMVKELHFFDKPANFIFPNWFYFRYHKPFNFKSGKKIYGEFTPIYMYWRSAAAHIWEYNPNIKLIAILRNPIDRAYSQWNMNIKLGLYKFSFREALQIETERAKRNLPWQDQTYSLIDRGFYSAQIREYRRFFPEQQLLFIKYDDFKNHPEKIVDHVFEFLDVDKEKFSFKQRDVNTLQYESPMDPVCKNELINVFKNDIHEVERLLKWDCSDWLRN